MPRKKLVLIVCLGLLALAGLASLSISAVPEPGAAETFVAGVARRTFVHVASARAKIPPAPTNPSASAEQGDKLFGTECADCHGLDGKSPTDMGRWIYPRAADLTSTQTQRYSDRELFWVVKNGIRLTGMPAFAKVETDEHIWDLVQFVRTLRPTNQAALTSHNEASRP